MSNQRKITFLLTISLTLQLVVPLHINNRASDELEEIERDLEKLSPQKRIFLCKLLLKPIISAFTLLAARPQVYIVPVPAAAAAPAPERPDPAGGGGDKEEDKGDDKDKDKDKDEDADKDKDKEDEKDKEEEKED